MAVEDTDEILQDNRRALERAGYRVSCASSLRGAQERIARDPPDLILLDIMLPDGSGLELCRRLRASPTPVLLLTSLDESEQVVQGLRAGGDDYITKPYRMEELLARIEAQLRRIETLRGGEAEPGAGRLRFDARLQRAFLDGEDLALKPKEYLLLAALARHRGRYQTAEELYDSVWGMAANNDLRTVLVHLSSLRVRLRQTGRGLPPVRIEREGKGYRLFLGEEDF